MAGRTKTSRIKGFTLIELATVLGLMGLALSYSVVGYHHYKLQALTTEAVSNVHAIMVLEQGRPDGPVLCAASPAEVPQATAANWEPSDGFTELGFSPGPTTRFSYQVTVEGGVTIVTAHGDLDGDGNTSTFELRSDGELHVEAQTE